MPTYDYECDACGHKMEIFQNISEEPLKKCPECKKKKFRRLFGAGAGILFKGSGFYQTDYRSDSYKQKAASDKPAPSSSTDAKGSSDSKSSGESKSSSDGGGSSGGKGKDSSGGSSNKSSKNSD